MFSPETKIRKIKRLSYLTFFVLLTLIIFIFSITNTVFHDRKIPKLLSSHNDLAVRGDIISSDNFKIATSKKIFKASIDIRFLDKQKEELFIKLFSIYSDIPSQIIRKKIIKAKKSNKNNLILSYNINARTAKNLQELRFKLRRLNVFKSIKIHGSKRVAVSLCLWL